MTHYAEEQKMQTTGQRIEEKQDVLKELDPEREERLSERFVSIVAELHDAPREREEIAYDEEDAERDYERALDEAIADEEYALLELWDSTATKYHGFIYKFLMPAAKAAIDRREEGR